MPFFQHFAQSALKDESSNAPFDRFFAFADALPNSARIVEFGTRRVIHEKPRHFRDRFLNIARENYLRADILDGDDVDVIADIEAPPAAWDGFFNAVIAGAVFEHLPHPWIAAKAIARILTPGGACYIATHQTFPLHAYPSDYFRFSREALSLLFEEAGMTVLGCAYLHRTRIVPPTTVVRRRKVERWNADWPSYLVVHLMAQKP